MLGRPFMCDCWYDADIYYFLDFNLQPITEKVNSWSKESRHFVKQLCFLSNSSTNILVYLMDIVRAYPNIWHRYLQNYCLNAIFLVLTKKIYNKKRHGNWDEIYSFLQYFIHGRSSGKNVKAMNLMMETFFSI